MAQRPSGQESATDRAAAKATLVFPTPPGPVIVTSLPAESSSRIESINGQPGVVTLVDGIVHNVVTFDFTDSAIRAIYIVVNPDKLRHLGPVGDVTAMLGKD